MSTFSLKYVKLKNFYQNYIRTKIDFKAVLSDVKEDGMFTPRFAFFSIISCAISTLGLLLNSPAVIIGAMLISPLMGPIVMQGFSLSMIDVFMFRKSTLTIFIGSALAIIISFCIVVLSPITEVNTEILARTSPNLFDLLIAVFSGLAAGYTFIKRKGSAIVGVAIATSLMPPLSVTGYGLATGNLWISEGAFFLFMTNLLAISLSVSIVSKLYGFGYQKDSRYFLWQTLIALSILIILGIPLGISLRNIAFQAYAASKTKNIIKAHFTDKLSRLNDFKLSIKKDNIYIDAVVINKKYDKTAKQTLVKKLEEKFHLPIELSLIQIALKNEQEVSEFNKNVIVKNNLVSPSLINKQQSNIIEDLKNKISKVIWFSYEFIHFDKDQNFIHIFAKHETGILLRSLRNSEKNLSKQFPEWKIFVYPSQQYLPSLYFERGQKNLQGKNIDLLEDIIWALKRWNIKNVDVIGYSSTIGKKEKNDAISIKRAENVSKNLRENGFTVYTKGHFNLQNQIEKEKNKGYNSYQRVDIRLHYDTSLKEQMG